MSTHEIHLHSFSPMPLFFVALALASSLHISSSKLVDALQWDVRISERFANLNAPEWPPNCQVATGLNKARRKGVPKIV
jgi:hypothetical protein